MPAWTIFPNTQLDSACSAARSTVVGIAPDSSLPDGSTRRGHWWRARQSPAESLLFPTDDWLAFPPCSPSTPRGEPLAWRCRRPRPCSARRSDVPAQTHGKDLVEVIDHADDAGIVLTLAGVCPALHSGSIPNRAIIHPSNAMRCHKDQDGGWNARYSHRLAGVDG